MLTSLSHYTLLFTLAALAFPHDTLLHHFTVFQDIAHTPYVALVGIVIVGFSSALGSFIGGARACSRRWRATACSHSWAVSDEASGRATSRAWRFC